MEYRVEHWMNKDATALAEAINAVAEQGWRLVTVFSLNSHELHAIFEREFPDPPRVTDMPGGLTSPFRRP